MKRNTEPAVSIPKPRRLAGGTYSGQIMIRGKRTMIHASSLAEYETKVKATKTGLLSEEIRTDNRCLRHLMEQYVEGSKDILSPSTLRGYTMITNHRFQSFIDKPISSIDWQLMIDSEVCSPKTLKNAWGFVRRVLSKNGITVPTVDLPKLPRHDLDFLDYEQILLLLDAVKNTSIELPIILALHSLRQSEILALRREDIDDKYIHVRRAAVIDSNGCLVVKEATKTIASTRDIPIMIDRLKEILPVGGRLVYKSGNAMYQKINRTCAKYGLPQVGLHGLRRSFASLGYHLGLSERSIMVFGGWSDYVTMHNFYIKLSNKDLDKDAEKMRNYYKITTKSL